MVSTEKLVKTYFSVMPERFKLLGRLRQQKARIDKKVLADELVDNKQIEQLMEIIGKDHIFRKAESREEPALRRIL